jgi:hypothetical protein
MRTLPQDAGIPGFQTETLENDPIDSRQILIAQQLEGVGDPFEKQRGVGPRRPSRHPLAARSISMSRPFPLLNETVTYY